MAIFHFRPSELSNGLSFVLIRKKLALITKVKKRAAIETNNESNPFFTTIPINTHTKTAFNEKSRWWYIKCRAIAVAMVKKMTVQSELLIPHPPHSWNVST